MRARVHSGSPVAALEWGTWASRSAFYHGSNLEHQAEISLKQTRLTLYPSPAVRRTQRILRENPLHGSCSSKQGR